MSVKDRCLILHRFRIGENSLLVKGYCYRLGKQKILVPNFLTNFRIGAFEPFNEVEIYLRQHNEQLKVIDTLRVDFCSKRIAQNVAQYFFLSRPFYTVLKFINEPDGEIYSMLRLTRQIKSFFEFNLIRFYLNLAHILGFSIENLQRPGWINIYTLTQCGEDEIKNPYCMFLSPKEFAIIKRVSDAKTKPFDISKKDFKGLEKFFHRFFELRKGQF